MVPIETFEMVDEQYTEFEDREAVREKEVEFKLWKYVNMKLFAQTVC